MNAETVRFSQLRDSRLVSFGLTVLLLVTLIAGIGALNATAQAFSVVQINPPGATASYALGVNKSNFVVGDFVDGTGATVGFGYLGAKNYKTFKAPGSNNFTRILGINDVNTAVGDFFGTDNWYHGFLLKNGGKQFVQYDIAKGTASTSIFTINAAGNFAGATGSGGPNQGFVNIQGAVTTFYAADTDNTFALGINKLNQVVGQYFDASNNSHGYLRDASGNISEIIYPGAAQTACTGITDSGEIVGWYIDSLGQYHGFTDNGGTFQTVNMIQIFGVGSNGSLAGYYNGPGSNGIEAYGLLATPATLNLTTLQIPGAQSTSTYGVNNANVLVGQYTDSQGNSHGMIISGNQITNLDDPKAATGQTVAQGINNNNEVVGYYLDSNNFGHGFQYSNGTFTDIGPAGNMESWAYNINDAGQIAGVFYDSNGLEHGYVKSGSTYTQFDAPGSNNSTALWGINNAGELAGQYLDAGGLEEAFIYKAGHYTNVNVPGATQSFAHSVNKNGFVVLTIFDFYGNSHGALFNGSSFYIFDDPTGSSLRGDGLNDSGLMVGRFIPNGNTVFQGFKGTL